MATNYTVDYSDKRFGAVEADKKAALGELEKTYSGMVSESDKYYQAQIDAAKDYADTQTQLQQDNTDFAIEQIEQQKEQAKSDYTKEQSAAYVDWQKQSNQYGANAEQLAAQGLAKTGYSESAQVSMYNTYQNRVATARESYTRAVQNYDNSITQARLQNNSLLAEIAYNSLQQQLELSLQGFQYKNSLILEQANRKTELENQYYNRYQDVLNQINQENALAEEVRQYNQNYELQQAQLAEQIRQYNQNYSLQQAQLAEERRQYDQNYSLQQAQLAEEKRQFEESSKSKSSIVNQNAVNTAYYSGALNPDANIYGTFSNGYQPKGISGHGTLKKTGDECTFTTYTLSGQEQKVTQNIWKAEDGTLWYWDGRYNKYLEATLLD